MEQPGGSRTGQDESDSTEGGPWQSSQTTTLQLVQASELQTVSDNDVGMLPYSIPCVLGYSRSLQHGQAIRFRFGRKRQMAGVE